MHELGLVLLWLAGTTVMYLYFAETARDQGLPVPTVMLFIVVLILWPLFAMTAGLGKVLEKR